MSARGTSPRSYGGESPWQPRFERERAARKEAERLLEEKSRELYSLNEQLREAQEVLEERVRERTRELEASRQEALRASEAKSDFLANMSHEIRTPITAILGFSELAIEQVRDPEVLKFVQTIDRNGRHLLDLVNDILDLSKIEAGKVEIEELPCSVDQLTGEVTSLLAGRASQQGLTLEFEKVGSVPEAVETDPMRLRQILLNIIGNAIKFTPEGSVRVQLRAARESGAIRLVFDVIDTGVGIGPDKVDRIFSEFEQADTSITRRFGGTGLGLALSRRMASMLGGEVELVHSEPEVGSTFRVTIRAADIGAPWSGIPTPAPRNEASLPVESLPSLEGLRVLLVEDSPTNRNLFVFLLEREGIQLGIACDGREALAEVERANAADEAYDVILMDMQMPVLDGYSAAAELRRRGETTPIIALTAQAMVGDRERCLAAGCTAYVPKPVDRRMLLCEILAAVTLESDPTA